MQRMLIGCICGLLVSVDFNSDAYRSTEKEILNFKWRKSDRATSVGMARVSVYIIARFACPWYF